MFPMLQEDTRKLVTELHEFVAGLRKGTIKLRMTGEGSNKTFHFTESRKK